MNLLNTFTQYAQDYLWVTQIVIIVLVAATIHIIQRGISRRIARRLRKTRIIWGEAFLSALHAPIAALIWLFALLASAHVVSEHQNIALLSDVAIFRTFMIILIIAWFFWRFINKLERKLLTSYEWRKASDQTTVNACSRIARIALTIAATLILLQSMGVPLTGVWAFGGGGAIVVGIAAKDLLANFFGGLMIYLDRPFKVGDWIASPDRDIEGTVQNIGWRTTCVKSFDARPLYIPNSVFSTISISNPQRMSNRRITTTIGLRYDDANHVSKIVHEIREMIANHPEIDHRQTELVHFVNFGSSSLDVNIYCFTKTTVWAKWRDVQQDVFLKILDIVESHGAEVAFPTTTMHIQKNAGI